MTHLPFDKLTFSRQAKYIYVARNPYDCCVSFYYFAKGLTPKTCEDVSFEKFLEMFLKGKTLYGDYFDHLLSWYNRGHLNNLLFLTYEDLKKDTRSAVLRVAEFLGTQHGQLLKERQRCLAEGTECLLPAEHETSVRRKAAFGH
ncbi:hypothetical protein MTO96_000944 [Rhipicephalus appendiculatus]